MIDTGIINYNFTVIDKELQQSNEHTAIALCSICIIEYLLIVGNNLGT